MFSRFRKSHSAPPPTHPGWTPPTEDEEVDHLARSGLVSAYGGPFLTDEEHEESAYGHDLTPMPREDAVAWRAQHGAPGRYPSEPSEEDWHHWRGAIGLPKADYPHYPKKEEKTAAYHQGRTAAFSLLGL